jgi:uncharacterized protein (TIGR00369 family)
MADSASEASARARSFTWKDPRRIAAEARGKTGLELLRWLIAEPHVPSAECLDFALVAADEGRAAFELTPAEFHANPMGAVHGGILATLCDSAAGAAVHSTLPVGASYTTLEIKVSFLRPVTIETGRVRCEGTLISRGSRIAVAQAHLRDAAGKLCAHATSTCMIFEGAPESGQRGRSPDAA